MRKVFDYALKADRQLTCIPQSLALRFFIIFVFLVSVLTWNSDDHFEGVEYAVSYFLTTWDGANSVCEANDAVLASAATQTEDSFLRDRFPFSSTT